MHCPLGQDCCPVWTPHGHLASWRHTHREQALQGAQQVTSLAHSFSIHTRSTCPVLPGTLVSAGLTDLSGNGRSYKQPQERLCRAFHWLQKTHFQYCSDSLHFGSRPGCPHCGPPRQIPGKIFPWAKDCCACHLLGIYNPGFTLVVLGSCAYACKLPVVKECQTSPFVYHI